MLPRSWVDLLVQAAVAVMEMVNYHSKSLRLRKSTGMGMSSGMSQTSLWGSQIQQ